MTSSADRHVAASATLRASGGACGPADVRSAVERPPRGEGDREGYERWLARVTERFDPPLSFLGILFALLAIFELADPGLSESWREALRITTWAIWGVFAIDFGARAIAAPSFGYFLRRHWLAALMLLVPTLRILRFGALLRVGRALPAARVVSTSYRAAGVARHLLRSRTSYLAATAAVVMLAIAQLAWLAERGHGTFATFGDALLWSASTVIAMQADPVPVSVVGRLLMIAGFSVGLVLIASLAGVVGAYLLDDRRERQAAEP